MGVMSVLSFSDVQYVGEQSRGTKAVEDILEESTLLQVDCPRQRTGENLSLAVSDRKQILLEVDYSRQVPNNDHSDDNHRKGDSLKEPTRAPRSSIDELTSGVHLAEKASCIVDDEVINTREECARFSKIDSSSLAVCSLSHSLSGSKVNEEENCVGEEQGSHAKEVGERDGMNEDEEVDAPCNAGSILSNISNSHAENGASPSALHELSDLACRADFEHGDLFAEGKDYKNFSACCISDQTMQITECAEPDHPVALWVKWRGKWRTGIRCLRADCPLPTLRAKPTHERKKYIAVFFPRGKTYSWVDMLLVRSIDEAPEPLAYGNHRKWRNLVKDLAIPRRYIMQRLCVAMLNISDQLHTEAVVEDARKAATWKEFAMEASRCKDYSELGKMLLKLRNMILQRYISPVWLENSFSSWLQRCQSARSAESIEILTEELVGSVTWNEVNELWNGPVQPELGSEWKTWKQEAMKWFSTSHPHASYGGIEQRNSIGSMGVGSQIRRKRPKLEIRQAESRASQMEASGSRVLSELKDIDTSRGHFNGQDFVESTPSCGPMLMQSPEVGRSTHGGSIKADFTNKYRQCSGFVEAKGRQCGRWANDGDIFCCVHLGNHSFGKPSLVCQAEGSASQMEASGSQILSQVTGVDSNFEQFSHQGVLVSAPEVGMSRTGRCNRTETDITYRYRQCSAFVEAKGRQCGRWANDGDIYCCVHLNNHSLGKSSQEEELMLPIEASMCGGTTTHGNKCKHRARPGSQFCKKHRLQRSHDSLVTNNLLSSQGNKLKRKHEENKVLALTCSSNITNNEEYRLVGEVKIPILDNLKPIVIGLPTPMEGSSPDSTYCIGYYHQNNGEQCLENAKLHTLYCEKHLPKFLKRARNGKSRLVSKDVFTNLLRCCSSRKQKLYLHRACELLYGFMRTNLSHQKPVSKSDSIRWILSETSKDLGVGEYLMKLVSTEREKLTSLWGFDADKGEQACPLEKREDHGNEMSVKCKICSEGFTDDQKLGAHWTEFHRKEGRWLFRGYACAVCFSPFTNRKVLEAHVKGRHGMGFIENSRLLRCMSCNSRFVNLEQLWQHVLSLHIMEFRKPNAVEQLQPQMELSNMLSNGISEEDGSQRYMCRFCGLRFDLLPDLGRHHQVAHMNSASNTHVPPKRGSYSLKRTRHCHPGFKKAFKFKNQSTFSMRPQLQTEASETVALGKLLESHCSDVAETLFSQIKKSKSRPNNLEILSIARSACCRVSLHATVESKYGIMPANLYLKAARLCSEMNIQVDWHLEGFICPKGCKPLGNKQSLPPLKSPEDGFVEPLTPKTDSIGTSNLEMVECHYILHPQNFDWKPRRKVHVLCEDVSFGKEPVPVACVLDEDLKNEVSYGHELDSPMPWQGFSYVTERLIKPSLGLDTKNSQLGCACAHPKCYPEKCDHVYLFDNDYENAKDIYGKSMRERFPYDERGRIVLEEDYLVYECNSSCKCDLSCHNRVLQKGVQVKMEIFRTESKGWAVRAAEAISRGTFVCEYIGEVLSDVEANQRGERYDSIGCSYLYDIDAHIDGARGLSEQTVPYVIDATKYGNVSRFINHSCSPNLVNHLVLVESMDCQLAHIGFYARRDIASGEELAYDYRYKLLPGNGLPCHCGALNCRGRLY